MESIEASMLLLEQSISQIRESIGFASDIANRCLNELGNALKEQAKTNSSALLNVRNNITYIFSNESILPYIDRISIYDDYVEMPEEFFISEKTNGQCSKNGTKKISFSDALSIIAIIISILTWIFPSPLQQQENTEITVYYNKLIEQAELIISTASDSTNQ